VQKCTSKQGLCTALHQYAQCLRHCASPPLCSATNWLQLPSLLQLSSLSLSNEYDEFWKRILKSFIEGDFDFSLEKTHFIMFFGTFTLSSNLCLMLFFLCLFSGGWCFDWIDFFNGFISCSKEKFLGSLWEHLLHEMTWITSKNINQLKYSVFIPKHVFEMKITLVKYGFCTVTMTNYQPLFVFWSSSYLCFPLFATKQSFWPWKWILRPNGDMTALTLKII